ncbi:UBA/EH/EF hand domain-containing protein Ucp8 [Schizosaccharomyces cryophilus OY26]|uniref:UBA/EH/EF hand domain-containing protein Ucp8 n=1 Tax=Schizosaccharomyces cryophilus (strain OY26 / ATCC MYA-4695 / CBS 11777 / NBRC 106824 / NRRL Y48691) TaxID=653667 RepID=S9X5Y5_SCHCR|nr:UBA/EH/EF hand domain-containing protein Ucp8 [Schizosaccharomyces cryophilus OY26]EPY49206.1 UBA/EH/EF hand domain-containing protein Ucp8 [Schizosaccharomyces cryophilus OY26]
MVPPIQLTLTEQEAFDDMLQTLPVEDPNCFPGSIVSPFLLKFGLPQKTLAKIWDFCDEEDKGYFTRTQAYACLRYVAQAQKGVPLQELDVSKAGTPPSFADGTEVSNLQTSDTTDLSPFRQTVDPHLRSEFEKEFYNQMDKIEDLEDPTLMPSSIAKPLFLESGLSTSVLAQIWNLADSGHVGYLRVEQFIIAKHLIMLCKKYNLVHLPRSLPSYVIDSAKSDANSSTKLEPSNQSNAVFSSNQETKHGRNSSSIPSISSSAEAKSLSLDFVSKSIHPEDRENFCVLFKKIDSENKGFITGEEAVPFFMASRLDPDELARIWELADKDDKGFIMKNEFVVAMQIIKLRLSGQPLDSIISSSSMEQSALSSKEKASDSSQLPDYPPISSEPIENTNVPTDEEEHFSNITREPTESFRSNNNQINELENMAPQPTLEQTIENLVPGGDKSLINEPTKEVLDNDSEKGNFQPPHANWVQELQRENQPSSPSMPHQESEESMNLPSMPMAKPEEPTVKEKPDEATVDPAEIENLQQQISSSKFTLETVQQSYERIESSVQQQKSHVERLRNELNDISQLKEATQQSISRNLMANQQLSAQVGELTMDKRQVIKELQHLRRRIDDVLADSASLNATSGINSPVLRPEEVRTERGQSSFTSHPLPKSSSRSSVSHTPSQVVESHSGRTQQTASDEVHDERKSEILQELLSMGFPKDKSLIALTAVNYDANEAINILLSSQ